MFPSSLNGMIVTFFQRDYEVQQFEGEKNFVDGRGEIHVSVSIYLSELLPFLRSLLSKVMFELSFE